MAVRDALTSTKSVPQKAAQATSKSVAVSSSIETQNSVQIPHEGAEAEAGGGGGGGAAA